MFVLVSIHNVYVCIYSNKSVITIYIEKEHSLFFLSGDEVFFLGYMHSAGRVALNVDSDMTHIHHCAAQLTLTNAE